MVSVNTSRAFGNTGYTRGVDAQRRTHEQREEISMDRRKAEDVDEIAEDKTRKRREIIFFSMYDQLLYKMNGP